MSDIELPPLPEPGRYEDGPYGSRVGKGSYSAAQMEAHARAAVELDRKEGLERVLQGVTLPASTDVEAMCQRVILNIDDAVIARRVVAMLRSLGAEKKKVINDAWESAVQDAKRIAALEAVLISKQIQIDTLEMLRERAAPPVDQYAILPPPATTSNSSGDSSSKASITGTSTASTSTGFSMDAPVRTGEVPSTGTIDQYHEPGLGLNKGDY